MKLENIERWRRPHPMGIPHDAGDPFGWFQIPAPGGKIHGPKLMVMVAPVHASDWQHVSVSRGDRTPTWEEMSFIKDLIWEENETVVQFHPPKSEYVNLARHCLHLWRYTGGDFPRPPKIYV